jgi:hypothetical protein
MSGFWPKPQAGCEPRRFQTGRSPLTQPVWEYLNGRSSGQFFTHGYPQGRYPNSPRVELSGQLEDVVVNGVQDKANAPVPWNGGDP